RHGSPNPSKAIGFGNNHPDSHGNPNTLLRPSNIPPYFPHNFSCSEAGQPLFHRHLFGHLSKKLPLKQCLEVTLSGQNLTSLAIFLYWRVPWGLGPFFRLCQEYNNPAHFWASQFSLWRAKMLFWAE